MGDVAQPISSVPAMQDQFAALDAETTRFQVAQASVQQAAAAKGGLADLAAQLATAHQKYGSMLSPTTAYGLIAKAGLDPNDPAFDQIAQWAAKSGTPTVGSWVGRGLKDVIGAVPAVLRKTDDATGNHAAGVLDTTRDVGKGVVRDAMFTVQSGAQEAEGAFRNVAAWKPGGLPVGGAIAGAVALPAAALGAAALLPEAAVGTVGLGLAAGAGALAGAVGGTKITGQGRWESQSGLGIAAGDLLHGRSVNIGTGLLPNTADTGGSTDPNAAGQTIAAEQTRRADRVTIAGHAVTPGRLLASAVVQPGSKPYSVLSGLVDADLNWHYDPAQLIGARAGAYARNSDLFVDGEKAFSVQGAKDFVTAGGLFSARPTISEEKGLAWLDGDKAGQLKQTIADTQGADAFGKLYAGTKGRLGVDTTLQLAKATTPEEVDAILRDGLTTNNGLRGAFDYTVHPRFETIRVLKDMPGTSIPAMGNPEDAVDGIIAAAHNAKLPLDDIHRLAGQMAEAQWGGDRHAVVASMLDLTEKQLLAEGWDPTKAKAATRMYQNVSEELRGYGISDVSNDWNPAGMAIDDAGMTPVANPHLMTEYQLGAIPLAETRDIRSMTSIYAPLLQHGSVWKAHEIGTTALDFLQGQVWKPLITMREALAVRTIADAQARMAAVGLSSMFHHPVDALAWIVSPESLTGRALEHLGVDVGKGAVNNLGERFVQAGEADTPELADHMESFQGSLNARRNQGGLIDDRSRTVGRVVFNSDNPRFADVRAAEANRLAADPIAREVARNVDDLTPVKDAFRGGMATELGDATTGLERARLKMASAPAAAGLHNPDVADQYIQSLADRLHYVAGGDSTIVDAIGSGRINGQPLRDGLVDSKALKTYMAEHADSAPPRLMGDLTIQERARHPVERLNRTLDSMFSFLVGRPDNLLSKVPTSKQLFWQRIEELAPSMTADAQAATVDAARLGKLDDVADRISALTKTGDLNNDSARLIADGFAADGVKGLLHDLGHHSQFGDQLRLVSPFAEAWRQMITKYATIGVQHPDAVRKVDQVIEGARGSGFFHKDSQGNEVFTYPGSGWISNKLIGVPVPLDGKIKGLTLATDVLPGIGPAVSVAAGAFLPDQPNWDVARKMLLPYGAPDTSSGFLEAFLPSWMSKLKDSGILGPGGPAQNQATFNSTVMDTARYLASTGKYDTSNPDDITRMLSDAREKSKWLFVLRAGASFVSPSAPTPRPMVQVKDQPATGADGKPLAAADQNKAAVHLATADILVKEYHQLLDDPATRNTATEAMLDKYGDGLFLLLQGKSQATVPDLPGSRAGSNWEQANQGVVKAHANVWGFFAPQDTGGQLDLEAYQRQVDAGQRVRLTPEQAVKLANDRVARAVYSDAKAQVGDHPNQQQRIALQNLQDVLGTEYPGYGDNAGVPQKASTGLLVKNLIAAAGDPRLASNPATSALKDYLESRAEVSQMGVSQGRSGSYFATAKNFVGQRNALRQLGEVLAQEDPGFAAMWDQVLSKELKNDVPLTAADVAPTTGAGG